MPQTTLYISKILVHKVYYFSVEPITSLSLSLPLPQESYDRAHSILRARAVEHKRLAEALLKYETLSAEEIKLVIAAKPLGRRI